MKFINLDSFQENYPTIELYRGGSMLTDLYNGCDLTGFIFNESTLKLSMKVVHAAGKQSIGTHFALIFNGLTIKEIILEGGMDNTGQLEDITLLDEKEGILTIAIAQSLALTIKCESLEINGI